MTVEIPISHRGKCPACGSPNLRHSFTASEFQRELLKPSTAVLCRVCPDVWVMPIWEQPAPTYPTEITCETEYVVIIGEITEIEEPR